MGSDGLRTRFEDVVEELKPRLNELVICISHSWGGLEQVTASDALDRAALGLKVQVMCLEGSPIHEHLRKSPIVTTVPLEYRPRDHFDLKLRRDLIRCVSEGVNLVHTHQPSLLGSITPWLWRRPGVSCFASRHIMSGHDKNDPYHRLIYSRLDRMLVMSQTLRQNVLDTHPLRDKQVKVVKLGLDFSRFDPERVDAQRYRRAWGATDDALVIGLVGRIDPAKGQATFIRAAATLQGRFGASGPRLKFVMVGEETLGRSSHHLEELREMANQFRLQDHVVFAGYQEEIPEVMRAFDILVMPSRQEAFGLVAIEAMVMGKPIVISRGGSAVEIVGDQQFGLLTQPEDAFDLQQQLVKLIQDPQLREMMGQRGRAHVLKNYDRRLRIHETLELYEWALRKRRAWGDSSRGKLKA